MLQWAESCDTAKHKMGYIDTAGMQVKFSLACFQINALIWLNSLELKVHYKMRRNKGKPIGFFHPSGNIYPGEFAGNPTLPPQLYSVSGEVQGTGYFLGDVQQIAGAV